MTRRNYNQHPYTAYHDYYMRQAGAGEFNKFAGAQMQYGYGLGGLLRNLIRRIIPLGAKLVNTVKPMAREAFSIAKPHLKDAAKEVGKHLLTKMATQFADETTATHNQEQTGSGKRKKKKPQPKKKSVGRPPTKKRQKRQYGGLTIFS